ncbi:MAG TPA: tetratricopeptide repeat protein, partial [Thermoanaerobaculia bacterium]|nr:tetratricopeptide repeat protein [Thermoanaerobaculia bacterium]
GWAHFQRGELSEARRYLERAAGLEPADATVHEHLGDVYAALGDVERARSIYRRALELGPDDAAQVEKKLRGLRGGS